MLKPIVPFEPVSIDEWPKGSSWVTQIKWDGVRMLAYRDGRDFRLVNRRLNDRTAQYPEFADPSRYCASSSFILDGEFIAFDENRPSFHEIMKRDSLRSAGKIAQALRQTPVTYVVFDLLFHNGDWITDQPLRARQQLLEQIVIPQPNVQLAQNFGDAEALFEQMKQFGMEGVVCKDLESPYAVGGKDQRWRKRKIFRDLYAVVGGVTFRDGIVNSLLTGLYDKEHQLIYTGHAGTGRFKAKEWRQLTALFETIKTDMMPFANAPERSKDAVWVEPRIVVRLQFLEWTNGGTMRHPSIQSLVDLPPGACTFQQSTS